MPVLLFTLLAVAVCMIVAGLVLSPKSQKRTRPEASYTRRPVRRAGVPQQRYTLQAQRRSDLLPWQPLALPRGFGWRLDEKSSWMGMTLVLVSVFLLGYILLRMLLPNAIIAGVPVFFDSTSSNPASSDQGTSQSSYNASRNLVRISQLSPAQYASTQEYNTWAMSACSAAAMTEVINAYGYHYRITDILKVESHLGEITPDLGLIEDIGIQRTVDHFGFKTEWGHNLSLDQVIKIANNGQPVIISFPPQTWSGGHLLVVTGGNGNYVYIADSSSYNYHSFTRTAFLSYWRGFTAVATPK